MAATIVLSAGLFIVDRKPIRAEPNLFIAMFFFFLLWPDIHFQYNGFLFGILLQSIASIYEGHYVLGGVCFAILLNLKHIFLYVAPAYFVFLLRAYCFKGWQPQLGNFLKLSVAVASVFCLSFGPFVINGGIGQVIGRLFPFKRGLVHAYWAANFWALYAFADRVLIFSIALCQGENVNVKRNFVVQARKNSAFHGRWIKRTLLVRLRAALSETSSLRSCPR